MSESQSEEYRFNRIEHDIAEIKASQMSMQASMAALQLGLADAYVPRREFQERRTDIDRQLTLMQVGIDKQCLDVRTEATKQNLDVRTEATKRLDKLDALVQKVTWAVISALVGAVIALLKAFLGG